MEADESATLAAIKDLRGEILEPLLAEHKGRIVKQIGDGAVVEFGSIVDASAGRLPCKRGSRLSSSSAPPIAASCCASASMSAM